ncbi:unnamed protein product [Dibothriocephalus latus]|uniref:Uncharacterized protein n=1 Tax=Dibothriocephalus latus TaxID=60516 RepID=A0A3P7L4C1_DIBLA|nr:unnamed protein product [Dibothriocephalus latus]
MFNVYNLEDIQFVDLWYAFIENRTADSLTMDIDPPMHNYASAYVYAGTFDPAADLNVYGGGCEIRHLSEDTNCQSDLAVPDAEYHFRAFLCTPNRLLCAKALGNRIWTRAPGK